MSLTLAACGERQAPAAPPPAPQAPPPAAYLVEGLTAPVQIVRDRHGIPHIRASSEDDLYFAQGFVQAQDRLFQMDLWRRSSLGRLSEVLGANFIERDAMTRRMRYRGPLDLEWAAYGDGTKAIAEAFVRGVNAWIDEASTRLPEEFALAGWRPEKWRAEDLLNRTDAFVASTNAQDEVFRARLVTAVGSARADALLASGGGKPGRTAAAPGVDLAAITYALGETIGRAGAPPYFAGLAAPLAPVGSNAWAATAARTGTGYPLVAGDPHRRFDHPAARYLVHLMAPGLDVIGATAPWLPGVAIGHNERVAWTLTAAAEDVQDIYVERTNPANARQVLEGGRYVDMGVEHDSIAVKGRAEPFDYDRFYTRHGVIVGFDRERQLAYALRWSGAEPGTAAGLAAPSLARARTVRELETALERWKMPVSEFVFAGRDGTIGSRLAGAVPVRRGGELPSPGWNGAFEWRGWTMPGTVATPADGIVVSANGHSARTHRIVGVLSGGEPVSVAASATLQRDTYSWTASRLIPLLAAVALRDPELETARRELIEWDRRFEPGSTTATLYASWARALSRALAERQVPSALVTELMTRMPPLDAVLEKPAAPWFASDAAPARDQLLADALRLAVADVRTRTGPRDWGRQRSIVFQHPLGVSARARSAFNVGPFAIGGHADTVMAVTERTGPVLRVVFDLADWDKSIAALAPGQSESRTSPHFADLAALWARGEYFALPFSAVAVQAVAESTLTLTPR